MLESTVSLSSTRLRHSPEQIRRVNGQETASARGFRDMIVAETEQQERGELGEEAGALPRSAPRRRRWFELRGNNAGRAVESRRVDLQAIGQLSLTTR